MSMPGDSFTFNTINSREKWGIKVIAYDVFSAPKRSRSQTIPFRSGPYDYGEKWYDERIIRLDCATEDESKVPDKTTLREIIYVMSQRGRLFLWDEPDKYYIGELFNSADIQVLPKYQKQLFTLEMVCMPFAYRNQVVLPLENGEVSFDYVGTAETPTLLVLRNNTGETINSVVVTAMFKQ